MTLPFDLGTWAALYMACVMVGAAFVRGYCGFGMPALVMASAALISDPLLWVPVVLICDFVLTVQQAPGVIRYVDWRRAMTLFMGAAVAMPVSVYFLTSIGIDLARGLLSAFVLVMCVLMWAGWRFGRPVGSLANVGVGVVSGVANGAAVGGLPVAVFFTALGLPAMVFRATIIGYFCLLDLWSLPVLWFSDLITGDTVVAILLSLPLTTGGVWAGSWLFHRSKPQDFRRFVILLLAFLAGLGLLKSVA